tara:strand:+ start:2784 stop:3356 length:573 start_codon:yes stop_codon:yes gene_type:complete
MTRHCKKKMSLFRKKAQTHQKAKPHQKASGLSWVAQTTTLCSKGVRKTSIPYTNPSRNYHRFQATEPHGTDSDDEWVEIDIITGIIQNTATEETYTLGESPRTYRMPEPVPNFYWWGRIGNSGGGSGPSDYRLALTEAGQCRQWKYKLVELDPKRWPTVDDFDDISVEELKAMYEGHPFNHSLQREMRRE